MTQSHIVCCYCNTTLCSTALLSCWRTPIAFLLFFAGIFVFPPLRAEAELVNLALNATRSGKPSPLESDRGWGGGSYPWELVDGLLSYSHWAHGLAFTGGHYDSSGGPPWIEPAGQRQATIDFGEPKRFEKVVIWHHGVEHTPAEAFLDYWDGSQWVSIRYEREYGTMHEEGTNSGYSDSDIYIFSPVIGSKVRYSFDNRGKNVNGTFNIHGWLYEFEVFGDPPSPATFTVTNTNDSGPGSLRQAIIDANNSSSTFRTIMFNISSTLGNFIDGSQLFIIQPRTPLPNLSSGVSIDGATQTDFSGDTNPHGPEIILNGSLQASGPGLSLSGDNNVVKNLVINGFSAEGIAIHRGVDPTPSQNQVIANYIGTDQTGTRAVPNGGGVFIGGFASPSVQAQDNIIQGNLISGNNADAVGLCDAKHTRMIDNRIGTDRTGTVTLGNLGHGIALRCAGDPLSEIKRNTIAFNSGDGINDSPDYRFDVAFTADGHQGNAIRENAIFLNSGLGINLLPPPIGTVDAATLNDLCDVDEGGNLLQNFPVITSVTTDGTRSTINGTLNSAPNQQFEIELFANDAASPSGFGQGQIFLGVISVATDTACNGNFSVSIPQGLSGKFITATATDFSGNTSKFSQAYRVPGPSLPAEGITLPNGGRVVIEFLSANPSSDVTLSLTNMPNAKVPDNKGCALDSLVQPGGLPLLGSKGSDGGCRILLDANKHTNSIEAFAPNTTLEFTLCVQMGQNCSTFWSSNHARNPDGNAHVRITPLHPERFPDQIFQMSWEAGADSTHRDFDDLIVVVRVFEERADQCHDCTTLDRDGDGLWNDWELFGIDTNGDGASDLSLPGADPAVPDVFVEIDYMDCGAGSNNDPACQDNHSHKPKGAAVDAVVEAFRRGGKSREPVALHIEVDERLPHWPRINFPSGENYDFASLKRAHFSSARNFAYHYCIFAHRLGITPYTGYGDIWGDDFVVTLGEFSKNAEGDLDADGLNDKHEGTVQQQAGTLMHELGHNLRLRHGGSDGDNYKPNYPSVMNYAFQLEGLTFQQESEPSPVNGVLMYSDGENATLDQNHLHELAVCPSCTAPRFLTRYYCPDGSTRKSWSQGEIDWNCNGILETSVEGNINKDADSSPILRDSDDWRQVEFDFHSTSYFGDRVHVTLSNPPEPGLSDLATDITSLKDSFVSQRAKNQNEGANNILRVDSQTSSMVAFDLSLLPSGSITNAKLILTRAAPTRQRSSEGGYVSLFNLPESFPEGDGFHWKAKPRQKTLGSGPGITWSCMSDSEIANLREDCLSTWNGGALQMSPAIGEARHVNNIRKGETVEWDVTAAVQEAIRRRQTEVGWLLTVPKGQRGQVEYYSKEGSLVTFGDPSVAPRLQVRFD